MKISHYFIERPVFATVIWIVALILGAVAYVKLPVEQYPPVTPPTVVVSASYPGASADVVSETVAAPLEQEINGVEHMQYITSQSTADGSMSTTVTFEPGTDLDDAQVQVQNRVAQAEPRLPEEVRRRGVTVRKNSPDLMLVVNLFSPDNTYDQVYIANYATLNVKDALSRVDGVGAIRLFGAGEYAMRVWLDPDKISSLGLTAGEVMNALRAANAQVAAGATGQQPMPKQGAFETALRVKGRLSAPEEFGETVIKSYAEGRVVRLKDLARVELGADSYGVRGYLGDKPAVALPVFQRPGSNALSTAAGVRSLMENLSQKFPPGLKYDIAYNPTTFVSASIDAVYHTIGEAVILVALVVMVFLQSWRASVVPIVAIPVSLIGTFAVMEAFGFSLNNLTLFGLCLAIGVVVDDAIVVVENMERLMEEGKSPKEAAHLTMDETGGALVAIGAALVSVFLPSAFVEGVSGMFFKQFGAVMSAATIISVAVSVTLSPALAAVLLKPPVHAGSGEVKGGWFGWFNRGMDGLSRGYGALAARLARAGVVMLAIYAGLMTLTVDQFKQVPGGFIPAQDQGYFIVGIQLPPGASLERTDKAVRIAVQKILAIPGVKNAVAFAGFSGATFTQASNAAAIFPVLDDFEKRRKSGATYDKILAEMRAAMGGVPDAMAVVIPPPPVRGVGSGGGFKMYVQDKAGMGPEALSAAVWQLAGAAGQSGKATSTFSFFETSTPQMFADVDRERAERLGVPVPRIFEALSVFYGSGYVNDFNFLGRTYRVIAQADAPFRATPQSPAGLKVKTSSGAMAPLDTVVSFSERAGASRLPRYNLYPAAELQGDTPPGSSIGETLNAMEGLAREVLPAGMDFEWTDLAYQQRHAGNSGTVAFGMAVVFVFLALAALYESWIIPLAVILIVPMCMLSALAGVRYMGMDNNILTQIGLLTLAGLACKNAILIVEFAREREHEGAGLVQAASDAARLRLRPILMTSFAFILGVAPLAMATGPGAEMRRALGVAVFSGMIGVTLFGLLFTPAFFVICRKIALLAGRMFGGGERHAEERGEAA